MQNWVKMGQEGIPPYLGNG